MLRNNIFILVFLSTLFSLNFPAIQASEAASIKTVTLAVENMTCRMCPITVRKSLAKVDGVINARSDFDSKTATVKFDSHKTNIEALIAATSNAGYPSSMKE